MAKNIKYRYITAILFISLMFIYPTVSAFSVDIPQDVIQTGGNYSINVNNTNYLEGHPASYFYQASNPFGFYNSTTLPLQNLSGYLNYIPNLQQVLTAGNTSNHSILLENQVTEPYCQGSPYSNYCSDYFCDQSSCEGYSSHNNECYWQPSFYCQDYNYYGGCDGSDGYEATCLSYGNDPTCNSDPYCEYDGSTQCDSFSFKYGTTYYNYDESYCNAVGATWNYCSSQSDGNSCENVGGYGSGQCSPQDYSYCEGSSLTCNQVGYDACSVVGGCTYDVSITPQVINVSRIILRGENGIPVIDTQGNTVLNLNLNSDLLDGYHYSDIINSLSFTVNTTQMSYSSNFLTISETWVKSVVNWVLGNGVTSNIAMKLLNVTNATQVDARQFKLNQRTGACTPLACGTWCKNSTATYYNASAC